MNDFMKDKSHRHKTSGLMGAAILITLGALFLLQNFTRFDFGETWPVLLIVIGVFTYLKHAAPALYMNESNGSQATVPPQQHDSQVNQ